MRIKIKDSIHLRKTQKDWLEFFEYNFVLEPNFGLDRPLTSLERKKVTRPLQAFCLGESSEGKHLQRAVHHYVQKSGNEIYQKIMDLFVKEENQHSLYLKTFMLTQDIPQSKHVLLDQMFRKLRSLSGLKIELITLLTAEILALSFYQALSQSLQQPSMKEICGKMIYDEAAHIVFGSRQLSLLGQLNRFYRKLLMGGSALFLWFYARAIFKDAGYSFSSYIKEVFNHLSESIEVAKRKDYELV